MAYEDCISNVKLMPCFLTLCFRKDVSGTTDLIDASPKTMEGKWVELSKVWVTRNADVYLRLYKDGTDRTDCPTMSLPELDTVIPGDLGIINTRRFKAELYSTTTVTGYICRLGIWVFEPTIADKVNMGIDLTEEEMGIATDVDLFTRFTKGLIPFSRDQYVKRIFHHVNKYVKAIQIDLGTGGARYQEYNADPEQIIVLEGLSTMDTSATTTNAYVTVYVDEKELITFPCPCLSIDYDIPLFIPAKDEITLEFSTDTTISEFKARWRVGVYRFNDRLKMMFGVYDRAVNEDLWKEVKAGV